MLTENYEKIYATTILGISHKGQVALAGDCLLYTSDAADE